MLNEIRNTIDVLKSLLPLFIIFFLGLDYLFFTQFLDLNTSLLIEIFYDSNFSIPFALTYYIGIPFFLLYLFSIINT
jgi:hypothetical protein